VPVCASTFLVVFLPILLFHAALGIDLREITEDAVPILTLAIVAVVAAAAAIGFGLALPAVPVPLAVALLFGAIVRDDRSPGGRGDLSRGGGTATANPAAGRRQPAQRRGGDWLFTLLVDMLTEGTHPNLAAAVMRFAAAFFGGLLLGALGGRLFGAILPYLGGSRRAEVTLSVALPYIACRGSGSSRSGR